MRGLVLMEAQSCDLLVAIRSHVKEATSRTNDLPTNYIYGSPIV